jgi:hypothetical protein
MQTVVQFLRIVKSNDTLAMVISHQPGCNLGNLKRRTDNASRLLGWNAVSPEVSQIQLIDFFLSLTSSNLIYVCAVDRINQRTLEILSP